MNSIFFAVKLLTVFQIFCKNGHVYLDHQSSLSKFKLPGAAWLKEVHFIENINIYIQ